MRCPPKKSETARIGGFTLIELLVSLVILSIIMVILGSGMRTISRASDANAEKIDHLDMYARTLDILKRDTHNLQRLVHSQDRTSEFLFSGGPDHLSFVVLDPPFPTHSALYHVQYSLKPSQTRVALVRQRARYRGRGRKFPGASPANIVQLMRLSTGANFEYGTKSGENINWTPNWIPKDRLPDLIKLKILNGGPANWPETNMIVRVRADAELHCIEKKSSKCSPKNAGRLAAQSSRDLTSNARSKRSKNNDDDFAGEDDDANDQETGK